MDKVLEFEDLCLQYEKTTKVGIKANILEEKMKENEDNKDFSELVDESVLEYLQKKFENKCTNDGFVLPNSIKLIKRTEVYFPMESMRLYYTTNATWSMKVCCPSPESILECKVLSKNKIGILAGLNDERSPLVILIPYDLCENNPEEYEIINNSSEGMWIKIYVLGKKFEQCDKKIIVIAKPYV